MAFNPADLAVGDEVIVISRHRRSIERVARKLKATIVTTGKYGEMRFNFSGRERGSDVWGSAQLYECNPETRADFLLSIKVSNLVSFLNAAAYSKLPLEKLLRLRAIIEEPDGTPGE